MPAATTEPSSEEEVIVKQHHVYTSLVTSICDSLSLKSKHMAREAAFAAMRAPQPRMAVSAARVVLCRVPKAAKFAIKEAILRRQQIHAERVQVRSFIDPYRVSFALRAPGLREQRERRNNRLMWEYIYSHTE